MGHYKALCSMLGILITSTYNADINKCHIQCLWNVSFLHIYNNFLLYNNLKFVSIVMNDKNISGFKTIFCGQKEIIYCCNFKYVWDMYNINNMHNLCYIAYVWCIYINTKWTSYLYMSNDINHLHLAICQLTVEHHIVISWFYLPSPRPVYLHHLLKH